MNENAPQSPAATAHAAPGWYPDPGERGGERWWDGFAWSEFVRPVTMVAPVQAAGGRYVTASQTNTRERSSKPLILGTIGVLWGGGILVNYFFLTERSGNGAYDLGSAIGMILGAALFGAGVRALHRWKTGRAG
ncbi:MAG: DUF2510 domain-containing protein [Solirubrobacterales bacterium]